MADSVIDFINYCKKHIKGDEKGEAQTFLDHLFMAFGYKDGHKEAGATFEFRVKDPQKKSTSFADLVWKPRVLIEMKKRGEDLSLHYQQAFSYWLQLVPDRPQYVILCNFDEFWIYDLNIKLYEPLDKIRLEDLEVRRSAFSFLLPKAVKPVFDTKREDVTEKAAEKISAVFKSMIGRGIPRKDALHFCLQCIVAMFAEDTKLLPDDIFTRLIDECVAEQNTVFGNDLVPLSYDLIGGLFREMNIQGITPAGKYKGVDYFNGGLFKTIIPVELRQHEISMLEFAVRRDWKKVNPAIFGNIFESFMDEKDRHKHGAHYTHETDILKVVDPVIIQPWTKKITDADTLDELYDLIRELRNYKVLDPACGSGNFLFIAFKEMKLLEKTLLNRIRALSTKREDAQKLKLFLENEPFVSTKQFYGMDVKEDAVELAKVTLMVAKELWVTQNKEDFDRESALPLDNLDENIVCTDALLNENGTEKNWPEVEAIIGNPPYQSKNKMQQEFGAAYMDKLRNAYSEVPGRADFCVYWYYKAHNHLKEGNYAGLVGTNTIRQNYSREGSLDYIVNHGGTITEAVSTEPWSGAAAVHVSIACWKKGEEKGPKNLYYPDAKGNLQLHKVPEINSSLSLAVDVVSAKVLECNKKPKRCFQGQTHGHEGFLLSVNEAKTLLQKEPKYADVLKPFLIGDEFVGNYKSQPKRFVIDFSKMDMMEASSYKDVFKIIQKTVLPDREKRAKEQEDENKAVLENNPKAKVNKHHINFYNKWWRLSYGREDMLGEVDDLTRYFVCSQVTLRPIFDFVSKEIRPNAALIVFTLEDDYSFGIIQSKLHWDWVMEKCSTLEGRFRYTTDTVWDTFPWPQNSTQKQIEKVAAAAKALRDERNKNMQQYNYSLRDLYRIVEQPGKNAIKDLHAALDKAVTEAYNFNPQEDMLTQLLALNLQIHLKEQNKEPVQAPGLPDWVKNKANFVSEDCIKFEG